MTTSISTCLDEYAINMGSNGSPAARIEVLRRALTPMLLADISDLDLERIHALPVVKDHTDREAIISSAHALLAIKDFLAWCKDELETVVRNPLQSYRPTHWELEMVEERENSHPGSWIANTP